MDKSKLQRYEKALEEYTKEITVSPEAARKALIREGIFLENGELNPKFEEASNYRKGIPER